MERAAARGPHSHHAVAGGRVLSGTRHPGPDFVAGLHRAGIAWDGVLDVAEAPDDRPQQRNLKASP